MLNPVISANGLCSYADSILNHRAAFDMVAIGAADVDPLFKPSKNLRAVDIVNDTRKW